MANQNSAFPWNVQGVTPAQRLLLYAIDAKRDNETGLAEVSLSALQEMTELSRRGITKALSQLEGRFLSRVSVDPGGRNTYRLLDDGMRCEARSVAINGNPPQAFNPAHRPPTVASWSSETQMTVATQQIKRQANGFFVDPSASSTLGDGPPVGLSPVASEPVSSQPIASQSEAVSFVQSVGHHITPANVAAVLAQPVVWQQIKHLAETVLSIQPSLMGDAPATPINPSAVMPEPVAPAPIDPQSAPIGPMPAASARTASPIQTAKSPFSAWPTQPMVAALVSKSAANGANLCDAAIPETAPSLGLASLRPPKSVPISHADPAMRKPVITPIVPSPVDHAAASVSLAVPEIPPAVLAPSRHPQSPPERSALTPSPAEERPAQPIRPSGPEPEPEPRAPTPNVRSGNPKRSPSAASRRSSTPSASALRCIPTDWKPSVRVYAWALKQGLTHDWVDDQVDEFITYWSDAGTKRASWDATFMHRLQYLQTHQKSQQAEKAHAISHTGLAEKDYDRGATPYDQIPWLKGVDLDDL